MRILKVYLSLWCGSIVTNLQAYIKDLLVDFVRHLPANSYKYNSHVITSFSYFKMQYLHAWPRIYMHVMLYYTKP